jgi:hypothetical protein
MNKPKTYVCWLAALAGLFLIGSLMRSPESLANGAFSSPVTVMNTTANPAGVLDAGKASRVPYQATLSQNCGNGVQQCAFFFTSAPSGFRLVVENVSGAFNINGATPPITSLGDFAGSGWWAFTSAFGQAVGGINCGFNQLVRAYFDSTDGQPTVTVVGNFVGISTQHVTLAGYLENCAIAGCPAVQH